MPDSADAVRSRRAVPPPPMPSIPVPSSPRPAGWGRAAFVLRRDVAGRPRRSQAPPPRAVTPRGAGASVRGRRAAPRARRSRRCCPSPGSPPGPRARAPPKRSCPRRPWRRPASRTVRMVRQISSRTSGASPSVASSRIRRRGLVISARPMASICCSPPESWSPRWPLRCAEAGKERQHALLRPGRRRAVRAGPRRQAEVLEHGQAAEHAAALRHDGDAAPRPAEGRLARHLAPVHQHRAGARRHLAHEGADQRGLAHAVAAHQADGLAGAHQRGRRRAAPARRRSRRRGRALPGWGVITSCPR